MNTNLKIILAFCLGIILKTLTTPWILGFFNKNYSIHKNKLYDAMFFGSITGLVQILINHQMLS